MMSLRLRKPDKKFVSDTKCFPTKSETFFASWTQNVRPQQMLRARTNGETFVSATMCPLCHGLESYAIATTRARTRTARSTAPPKLVLGSRINSFTSCLLRGILRKPSKRTEITEIKRAVLWNTGNGLNLFERIKNENHSSLRCFLW